MLDESIGINLFFLAQLFIIGCNEMGWYGARIIIDSVWCVINIFTVSLLEQVSNIHSGIDCKVDLHSLYLLHELEGCFCLFLSTMLLKSPWSFAAFVNLLLLFIFIVSVASIQSWKLIQYWVILELGSYADDKPLTVIKYTMPSWLRFPTFI